MKIRTGRSRLVVAAAALAAAFLAPTRAAQPADDTALFSATVPPNVMIIMDNSGSMNNIVWHADFDASATYSCNRTNGFTSDQAFQTVSKSFTKCGKTRTVYSDPQATAKGENTNYDADYLNWIFSLPNGDSHLTELAATNDGTYSTCLQAQGYTTFTKYRRTRISAGKDVMREVVCNINAAANVRFGIAQFRLAGGSDDPNGGYVRVPINNYNATPYSLTIEGGTTFTGTHQQQLDKAINAEDAQTWTPLGETLFQIYTYFMSRTAANRPKGQNGTTVFPGYSYTQAPTGNFGPYTTTTSLIPADPVQYDCQKNFVIIITDGEPTKDDFAANKNTADQTNQGFSSFMNLIGNYNNDGETEVGGTDCVGGTGCALYLDDIAKFMQKNDFRPDRPGTQVIDVYTVGFTTSPQANDLLARTAAQGNGRFYHSNSAEALADALVDAIADIVQKAQSFTAATVPATRTSDGGNIYTSLFVPQNNNPFWEGHLKLFKITSAGDILDSTGACALVSPMPPGECKSGPISATASPYWDAATVMPAPNSRTLYTSMPSGATQIRVPFDQTLGVNALGDPATTADDLTLASIALYPGSGATTVIGLKNAIIQNVRGCVMGTGVTNTCVVRPAVLGDIFHSNPLVVGDPRSFIAETSYSAFVASHNTRPKRIYAGANDGFLHAFDGGTWVINTPPTPPGYDRGTGVEQFGFMPWPARRNIRNLPIDTGSRDFYFVDGSPVAADVWIHATPTELSTAKAADGSEWKTVLMGGLRQGGRSYYALDVSDPTAASYPAYMWEFPQEGASTTITNYMGETWGQPIITKVKVVIGGIAYERWVAVVTGGYDASGDPNDIGYSANATAGRSIYIVDMKTGGILAQKKFNSTAPASDPTSQMRYAIASTPAVLDLDGDEFADVIYVGDLGGNLWKWVVSYDPTNNNYGTDPINSTGDVNQPNWKFSQFFQAKATTASTLGVTVGANTYYKSIYFPPAATYVSGALWLAFGTGERHNLNRAGDTTTTAENNRLYAVVDPDPLSHAAIPAPMNESTMRDATNDGTCASQTGFTGYFVQGRDGEKFVTDVDVFAYQVLAASYLPAAAGNPCSTAGNGTLYVFRIQCGQGFFTGTDANSRRLDLGIGMPTDPRITVSPNGTRVIITQQDGTIENNSGPPIDPEKLGQLYWREMTD